MIIAKTTNRINNISAAAGPEIERVFAVSLATVFQKYANGTPIGRSELLKLAQACISLSERGDK